MAAKTLSVEQFVQMDTAENETYELVDGELVPLPSATPLHSEIRGRLEQLIRNYLDRSPIGGVISETNCLMEDGAVRKPDLCIFFGDRWRLLDLRKVPVGFAPDIAVEVLSPNEHAMEVNRKVREYFGSGSQEVWRVDPENVEVHVRTKSRVRVLEGKDRLESGLLPGFSVVVGTVMKAPTGLHAER